MRGILYQKKKGKSVKTHEKAVYQNWKKVHLKINRKHFEISAKEATKQTTAPFEWER